LDLKRLLRRMRLVGVARYVLLRLLAVPRLLVRLGWMKYTSLPHAALINMGSAALARGQHRVAMEAYIAALSQYPEDSPLRLQIGVTAFLMGEYQESEKWFVSLEQSKHFDLSRWGMPDSRYRVLDRTWLLAIGHVAFLDTYVKAASLGWFPEKTAVLGYNGSRPPAGWPLFRYFDPHIKLVASPAPEHAVDEIVHGPDYQGRDVGSRDYIRAALSQPFWFGPDEQGRTRWFAPFGAAVEAAWKAAGRGPICVPTGEDRQLFRRTMESVFGLPQDAWFIVLHVREPGYHAAWHRHHPGTRNAEISTYDKVIDFVVARGGWVVRGGDPSMTKIAPREHVIDYATSPWRSAEIDILLCAECKYFVGTNSGFSVVPPVFGKRCALTNWSPVGIPNWYLDDIYIPKLVRPRSANRYLTFTEMFSGIAGWSQFERDYRRGNLLVEDNDVDDLLAIVQELHGEVFDIAPPPSDKDSDRLRRFNEIALAGGGYIGSRMSYRFLERYEHLLD
jgi:putative glycosyltransferase (TIGR04372 family)